jgi:hypothetical protein
VTACLCGEESQELVHVLESTTFEAAHFVAAEEPQVVDAVHAVSGLENH